MNVGILGCGWLGLPLAKSLRGQGHRVTGSTTSAEKLPRLAAEGIKGVLISVSSEGITGDIRTFLAGLEVLIINIPPGLRKDPSADFAAGMKKLVEELESSEVKKVIFVSSIAVYRESEAIPVYTEKDAPNGTSNASRQLIAAERLFSENPCFEAVSIRFGGLLGGERHPVKYLAGRGGLKNPEAPVNLVHREDCIGSLEWLLDKGITKGVFNAVFPAHPSRQDYYRQKATELQLEPPRFDRESPSVGKVIESSGLREMGFKFKNRI